VSNEDSKDELQKYHEIVEEHPAEVIAVTKREKRLAKIQELEGKIQKDLEDQALRARIKGAVLKW
jgi:hypothetical protein